MYVYYDLQGGKVGILVIDNESYPWTQYYPSECIWMVPGTVDPMED
jgi:hypothetical protein